MKRIIIGLFLCGAALGWLFMAHAKTATLCPCGPECVCDPCECGK